MPINATEQPDEPLAAELDELLPGLDELEDLTANDLSHVAEGYYPDECCDGVDNDGNGATDECCVDLRTVRMSSYQAISGCAIVRDDGFVVPSDRVYEDVPTVDLPSPSRRSEALSIYSRS